MHLAQLYRSFSITNAKFAILTNGRVFHFHSDLEEPNKQDTRPFLTFDIAEPGNQILAELKKFANAGRLKYTSALKAEIANQIEAPTDDFVRLIASGVHKCRSAATIIKQCRSWVKAAFREVSRDSVQDRLSTALATVESAAELPEAAQPPIMVEPHRNGFGFRLGCAIEALPCPGLSR